MTTQHPAPTQTPECCPKFDPTPWQDKMLQWDNKKFIKAKVFTIFYIPLNFGSVITKLNKLVEKAGGQMPDWLCLSDHTSKWNMDLYLAVDRNIPGAQNVTLSGKFYTQVYEGEFSETGKWCADYETQVKTKGMKAKKWGKNYVVIVGEVM